ncbi:hypothetical protein lerEdw1_019476 [Lerista edwardsae]|nr:hypothetical protein lerEdw1_019476 [Lerista edwardsae]
MLTTLSYQSVVEYLSAFDEEVLEPPALDSASGVPFPVEGEEAAVSEAGESSLAVAGAPEVRETGVAEAACEKSKAAFSSGGTCSSPFYYFYQAEDGQCLYLHPVNVRCLVHEYGSLEKSPEKITATVVEISGHSMTEVSNALRLIRFSFPRTPLQDVRQRHRYLCHLPLTCEFSICELALTPPVISKETLQMFSDDIEKRKRLRQKKARDERRRERRIEMEENKKQGRYPEVRIALENLQQFPAFSPCAGEAAGTEDLSNDLLSPLSRSPISQPGEQLQQPESLSVSLSPTASLCSPSLGVGSLEEDSPLPSFAQMLRAGKAKPEMRLKAAAPKQREENHTLAPPAPGDSDAESDNSDRVPVPSFQNSFSQAIEAAFLKLDKPSTPDLLLGNTPPGVKSLSPWSPYVALVPRHTFTQELP